MESKFVTVQAHWVTLDEFGDGGEAVAQQAALTKRARLLGLCLLQSQQLELAFEGLAKSLGVTNDEASSVPLGKLLAKLHGSIPAESEFAFKHAIEIRNTIVHGHLTVGLSTVAPGAPFEEIGVDLWLRGTSISLVEETDASAAVWSENPDPVHSESMETWMTVLSDQTKMAVELWAKAERIA